MNDPNEFVTIGALMTCPFGAAPMPFTPTSKTVVIQGKLVANTTDKVPLVNIPSFVVCSKTQKPCVPVPAGEWAPTHPTQFFGAHVLKAESKIKCGIGGCDLSFLTSGQIPLPETAQQQLDEQQAAAQEQLAQAQARENAVGESGLLEGFIPVWGSGRDAVNAFQTGNWGWGLFHSAMVVVDVATLGGGSLVKGGVKALLKTGAREVAEQGAKQVAKEAVEQGVKTAVRETSEQLAKTGGKKLATTGATSAELAAKRQAQAAAERAAAEAAKKGKRGTGGAGRPKRVKLKPGSPEHKAQRWADYKKRGGNYDYDRWSKQYDTNMQNATHGLQREAQYRQAMGGGSKTVKTRYTNRQIDVHLPDKQYMGQVKTGRMSLTEQAKLDIKKDRYLVRQGNTVEYILEKGASKPFLDALDKAGIKYHIGPKI
jgi:hypothetical protein